MDNESSVRLLYETFVTFNIAYAGLIAEIPNDADMTARTDILRMIDAAKKQDIVSATLTDNNLAWFGVNAFSIRITMCHDNEVVLTVPLHMIAACSYVKDEGDEIIAVKIGEVGNNRDINDLALIYCKTETDAEKICSALGQCFQMVFSEATVKYFDKRVMEGITNNIRFNIREDDSITSAETYEGPSFISGSRTDLTKVQPSKPVQLSSSARSNSDTNNSNVDVLQDFMLTLKSVLSSDELCVFAGLITRWRGDIVHFSEFCTKIIELYGNDRKYLLGKMRPFLREQDLAFFYEFCRRSSVDVEGEPEDQSSFIHAQIESSNVGGVRKKIGFFSSAKRSISSNSKTGSYQSSVGSRSHTTQIIVDDVEMEEINDVSEILKQTRLANSAIHKINDYTT